MELYGRRDFLSHAFASAWEAIIHQPTWRHRVRFYRVNVEEDYGLLQQLHVHHGRLPMIIGIEDGSVWQMDGLPEEVEERGAAALQGVHHFIASFFSQESQVPHIYSRNGLADFQGSLRNCEIGVVLSPLQFDTLVAAKYTLSGRGRVVTSPTAAIIDYVHDLCHLPLTGADSKAQEWALVFNGSDACDVYAINHVHLSMESVLKFESDSALRAIPSLTSHNWRSLCGDGASDKGEGRCALWVRSGSRACYPPAAIPEWAAAVSVRLVQACHEEARSFLEQFGVKERAPDTLTLVVFAMHSREYCVLTSDEPTTPKSVRDFVQGCFAGQVEAAKLSAPVNMDSLPVTASFDVPRWARAAWYVSWLYGYVPFPMLLLVISAVWLFRRTAVRQDHQPQDASATHSARPSSVPKPNSPSNQRPKREG